MFSEPRYTSLKAFLEAFLQKLCRKHQNAYPIKITNIFIDTKGEMSSGNVAFFNIKKASVLQIFAAISPLRLIWQVLGGVVKCNATVANRNI